MQLCRRSLAFLDGGRSRPHCHGLAEEVTRGSRASRFADGSGRGLHVCGLFLTLTESGIRMAYLGHLDLVGHRDGKRLNLDLGKLSGLVVMFFNDGGKHAETVEVVDIQLRLRHIRAVLPDSFGCGSETA